MTNHQETGQVFSSHYGLFCFCVCVCVRGQAGEVCVCVCVLMSWDDMFALCPNAYMFVCDVHVNAHVKTFIYELAVHVSRPTVLDSVPCICICVCES